MVIGKVVSCESARFYAVSMGRCSEHRTNRDFSARAAASYGMIAFMLLAAILVSQTWSIACAGELALDGVLPEAAPLKQVAKALEAADLSLAQLGSPLTRSSRSAGEPAHAGWLRLAGLDILSLGNGRVMSAGPKGFADTIEALAAADIAFSGAAGDAKRAMRPVVVRTKNGIRVAVLSVLAYPTRSALLGATPARADSPGVNVLNFGGKVDSAALAKIASVVQQSLVQADVLVVSLHWGNERQTTPTSYQVSLGRAFAEAGADLVVGHNPNALQGAERHRGVPILYSLGTLVSDEWGQTAVVRLSFEGRELTNFEIVPCRRVDGRAVPLDEPDAGKARVAFGQLGLNLMRQYPSPESKPLF